MQDLYLVGPTVTLAEGNMIKCPHWNELIQAEREKAYFTDLEEALEQQRSAGDVIFPPEEQIFSAFEKTSLADIKVVILGQDPYHGAGQAHGLAFSVSEDIKVPPSLKNIYKELETDIDDFSIPTHGNLTAWAEQGVLLLNTVLTVKEKQAHSHAKLGWERFTGAAIQRINETNTGCVFMLWGSHAHKKGESIDGTKHKVLKGPHPSPLSAYRGFFGCKHFSSANRWLVEQKKNAIDWQLTDTTQASLF